MNNSEEMTQMANGILIKRTVKSIIIIVILVLSTYLIANKYIPESELKNWSVFVACLGILINSILIAYKLITSKQIRLLNKIDYIEKDVYVCPNCGSPRIKRSDFNNWICESCYTNGKTKELKIKKIKDFIKENDDDN
jgi:ribosomal protein L37AE/L43A